MSCRILLFAYHAIYTIYIYIVVYTTYYIIPYWHPCVFAAFWGLTHKLRWPRRAVDGRRVDVEVNLKPSNAWRLQQDTPPLARDITVFMTMLLLLMMILVVFSCVSSSSVKTVMCTCVCRLLLLLLLLLLPPLCCNGLMKRRDRTHSDRTLAWANLRQWSKLPAQSLVAVELRPHIVPISSPLK